MTQTASPTRAPQSRAHRFARVLVCATFPLIWIGGLVTTYDAGMAVPDWPGTFGYNLFLYPWQTWLFGPFDLFIEHGHRLFAAVVGMLTIAVTWIVWRSESSKAVRWLAVATLTMVVLQGVLGGMRVLLVDRTFAMIHGCVGPIYFALTVALATITSRRFLVTRELSSDDELKPKVISSVMTLLYSATAISYLQLVLGANVRHVSVTASYTTFQAFVALHIVVAFVLAGYSIFVAVAARKAPAVLRVRSRLVVVLILGQICLGAASWVVKYGFPSFAADLSFAQGFVVSAQSLTQAMIVTAHVAIGSLILVTNLSMTIYAARYAHLVAPQKKKEVSAPSSQARLVGVTA